MFPVWMPYMLISLGDNDNIWMSPKPPVWISHIGMVNAASRYRTERR